jgi:uncharacterized DUF497 family protein
MVNTTHLDECRGFERDDANATKIWERHAVTPSECEQVLLGRPLVTAPDIHHSRHEARYYALGRTGLGRRLFVVFTIRGDLVRVISARDMSRRERKVFRRAEEQD